jgi:hypothetical protein
MERSRSAHGTGEVLLGKQLVLADVRTDHLSDLSGLQQQAEADAVHAGIVGNEDESRAPESRMASIRVSGMPHRPNPPAMIVIPSFNAPASVSAALP